MKISVERLTKEALALPVEARAELADRLAESLDPSLTEDFRAVCVAEAFRRRDEIRSGQVKTVPAESFFTRIRKVIDG